jgi:hypothetical protein
MPSEKRIAQVASIPARVETLRLTVRSLLPQTDMMFVALNGYEDVPDFLTEDKKIVYALMDNSLGDAAKFYDVDQRNGYVLTCDDDLVYPEGYVRYMINGIKQHGGIVSLLGKRYDRRPINSSRSGYTSLYRCLTSVKGDHEVHLGGTGAMAFHTDSINISIDDFPVPNMADIWMAKAAHEQGVKITSLGHPARYVSHKFYSRRIWVSERHNDAYQTEILNSFLK